MYYEAYASGLRSLRPCWKAFLTILNVNWLSAFICLVEIFSHALAHGTVSAPAELRVIDTPNDGGGSLTVVWAPSPSDSADGQYQVLIGETGATDPASFKVIAEFPANTRYVKDAKGAWWTRAADPTWHQYVIRSGKGVELKDGTVYPVTVAMRKGDERAVGPLLQGTPDANWFN